MWTWRYFFGFESFSLPNGRYECYDMVILAPDGYPEGRVQEWIVPGTYEEGEQ